MSRCIAVRCWRTTVGMSRWCRKHTDMILDLPDDEWPTSRREARAARRVARFAEELRRARWEPTTPPPGIQSEPGGPQCP